MLATLRTFASHRWGRFRDRASIERHQSRAWHRMRRDVLPMTAFYSDLSPEHPHDVPRMDRERLMAAFDAVTTTGLCRADAEAIARAAEPGMPQPTSRADGIAAGFSTGTSGTRGLFLTSPAERRLWAAALIGRFLPRPAIRPQRIALFLRADNRLYDSLNRGIIRLQFYSAATPAAQNVEKLAEFDPTVLAGPPSILIALAKALKANGRSIRPSVVLCGAEPAEPQDLQMLHNEFGVRPDIIYQCTEGVLAMTCRHGRLHLNERHVAFRREIIDEESGAFVPIISDLSRRSLMILNYRLDDVLVPELMDCACGCATAGIRRIEGRLADAIFFEGDAGRRWISSESLRQAALSVPCASDWSLVQSSPDHLRFHLPDCNQDDARRFLTAACAAIARDKGCIPPQVEVVSDMPVETGIKRRRIRRLFV